MSLCVPLNKKIMVKMCILWHFKKKKSDVLKQLKLRWPGELIMHIQNFPLEIRKTRVYSWKIQTQKTQQSKSFGFKMYELCLLR